MVLPIIKTLIQSPNINGEVGYGGRIRKRSLTAFLPNPDFITRQRGDDQRSYHSLITDEQYNEESGNFARSDNNSFDASFNSFQSLPTDINEVESDPELQTLLNKERESSNSIQDVLDDEEDENTSTNRVSESKLSVKPVAYYPEDTSPDYTVGSIPKSPDITRDKILRLSRRKTRSSITSRKISSSGYGAINNQEQESLMAENEENFAREVVTMKSEFKTFLKNTIPLVTTFCLSQAYTILCTITASKVFGKDELSAVSLGSMTVTITFSIFEGVSTALDVLNPQAYGSGNSKKVGLYTQRSITLSFILFIPFAIIWWYSEYLFSFILDSQSLVQQTASFLKVLILSGPAYIIFENLKRYLQCQGIFNATTIILFISAPLSIVIMAILVSTMGFVGIPITCVLNFWIMAVLMITYVMRLEDQDCWTSLSWQVFKGWKELLKFSFAGVICTFLEASSWEILTLFSSFFGTSALAAQSAISTVASLTFFVPFAVGISSSTRVGYFVGAGRIDGPAQIATKIGLYSAVVVGILNGLSLYFGRFFIARIYSNDREVVQLIIKVLPIVAAIQIFDALNTVAGSLLRGQGSPFTGGVINFVAYNFFAIPLAIILGYHFNLELIGLWIGIGLGLFVIGLSETYFVVKVDWEAALRHCMERNKDKV